MNNVLEKETITKAKRYYDVSYENINNIWNIQLYQKKTNIIMFSFSDKDLDIIIDSLSVYLEDVGIKN